MLSSIGENRGGVPGGGGGGGGGKDGLVRVVSMNTSHGVYHRPVTMVIPLLD